MSKRAVNFWKPSGCMYFQLATNVNAAHDDHMTMVTSVHVTVALLSCDLGVSRTSAEGLLCRKEGS